MKYHFKCTASLSITLFLASGFCGCNSNGSTIEGAYGWKLGEELAKEINCVAEDWRVSPCVEKSGNQVTSYPVCNVTPRETAPKEYTLEVCITPSTRKIFGINVHTFIPLDSGRGDEVRALRDKLAEKYGKGGMVGDRFWITHKNEERGISCGGPFALQIFYVDDKLYLQAKSELNNARVKEAENVRSQTSIDGL
jgi:hypothetical protein